MDKLPKTLDWNKTRAFLATAETGSLSGAARRLGLTQPTLSRQVSTLEQELGVILFQRNGKSLVLSEAGQNLLPHARVMSNGAEAFSLRAAGQVQTTEGHVTITTTDIIATHFMPRVFERLRREAPNITLEIIARDDIQDLHKREADISIRHQRPQEPNLTARKLADMPIGLFASPDYLDRLGRPCTLARLKSADFIVYARSARMQDYLNSFGLDINEANMVITCASGCAVMSYVRAGLGVSAVVKTIAQAAGLEQVLASKSGVAVPIWLVTHQEVHSSPRIRLVFDLLAAELNAQFRS
ncbi:LysR family transcriptional regulator [Amylibacter marinus]|uniref:LysR family transcriptional regulator n=1 Tax=Amylibacter marinus TaxID=1475483 RepID=A0ABQ5VSK7_9RHOB|nr:LysR family transcriptional regulator [Amylibacter marinus]GLQ34314.1 LysR family transcriptional regulator [Amylibacter marinus]